MFSSVSIMGCQQWVTPRGALLSYIVLFKQLTGTRSPFAYPLLIPPLPTTTGSSAAVTAMQRDE